MNKTCNQTAQDKSSKTSPCRPSAAKIQLVYATAEQVHPSRDEQAPDTRRGTSRPRPPPTPVEGRAGPGHPSRDEQAPAAADTRRGTSRPPPTPVEGRAGPGHPSRDEQAPAAADTRRAPAARADNTRRGTSRPVSDMEKLKPNSTR